MKAKPIEDILRLISEKGDTLTLDELIAIHIQLEEAAKLAKTIEKHIITLMSAGIKANGYKLVKTKGRAKITNPRDATDRLLAYAKDNANVKLLDLVQPMPLGKLKDTLGADVVAEKLGDLIDDSGDGDGYTYAPTIDTRPEITIH